IVFPIADADAAVKALAGESLARVYHYGSAVHGQPLVNGSTDFKPAFVRFLEGDASPVRSLADLPQGLRMLSDLGVRHVIVHRQDFENAAFADAIVGRIRSTPDIVTSERRFGETLLFGLAPPSSHATRGKAEPPRGVPLPLESFKIRASHRSDRARFAVDGSLETRWISGSRQTGEEWLELAFAEPRDVAHVRLSFHSGSLGDYPRGLRIETSEDGRTYRPLVAETPLPRLARSLIQSPRTPHIHIALSSNRSRLLRLRQTGTSRSWQWAANEIEVWQRPDTGS
ncbi:MAG: discoidin domain-containing protein, partial [Acidobacteria bacterium]|nr:discoidin domain-containing protein [Acidobacteriota bacterium]